mgnify:CR=1 FL=1
MDWLSTAAVVVLILTLITIALLPFAAIIAATCKGILWLSRNSWRDDE